MDAEEESVKVQLISDVHAEFHADGGKEFVEKLPVLGDVLVVAGDLGMVSQLYARLTELCAKFKASENRYVVYVPGNHEYYHTRGRDEVNRALGKVERRCSNFVWLNNSVFLLGGRRFVGTTMWFPHDPLNVMFEHQLSDFSAIPGYRKWVYEANDRAHEYLSRTVMPGDIVVTHHVPSYVCVPERYRSDDLNRFFVSPWAERIIYEQQPAAWLFGHTHACVDGIIEDTRMVCNPFGYAGRDEVAGFDPGLVIEL
jgi:Icc-related predicted phosphoesterase